MNKTDCGRAKTSAYLNRSQQRVSIHDTESAKITGKKTSGPFGNYNQSIIGINLTQVRNAESLCFKSLRNCSEFS